jgi:hypothetical protein
MVRIEGKEDVVVLKADFVQPSIVVTVLGA